MTLSLNTSSLDRDAARASPLIHPSPESLANPPSEPFMQIIRRNGKVSPFDAGKISVAMTPSRV